MTTAVTRITPCPPGFSDHTYKVAHGVEIPLRVWPAPEDKKDAPWLLWFHGGGFISGKHAIPNAWVYRAFHDSGYHIVSAAYRLMPEASYDEILSDCKDSLAWSIAHLPEILGQDRIDIDRYVVGGDSAGGTLSTLAGHLFEPKPKVVIDVFGLVDSLDLPANRLGVGEWSLKYDNVEEVMEKAKMNRDPSKAQVICPWNWEFPDVMDPEDLRSFWGIPDWETTDKHLFRMDLNNYISLKDERFEILYRKDAFKSEDEYITYSKSVSPFHLLDQAKTYPPTFVLHGTGDSAVPVEQSYKFVEALKGRGVQVDARYKEGGEHCFENKIERPGDEGWDEFIVPCMEFVNQHIGK